MTQFNLNDWVRFSTNEKNENDELIKFEGKIVKINESAKGLITYTVENLMSDKKKVTHKNESIRLIQVNLINRSSISKTIANSILSPDDVRFIRKYWGRISRKHMASLFNISTAFAYKTATRRTMFSIPNGEPTDELVIQLGFDFLLPKVTETV